MPDQANYENSLQNESVRAPADMEAVINAELGTSTEVYLNSNIPDGQAYIVPGSVDDLDAWLAEHPGHTTQAKISITAAGSTPEERARVSPSQQKYFVAPEQLAQWQAERTRLQKVYTENELQAAELRAAQEAARREIENQVAAEFRPRSDEAADLQVVSGLSSMCIWLGQEQLIATVWKPGWAERLVDAVRQVELDPPEDNENLDEGEQVGRMAADLRDDYVLDAMNDLYTQDEIHAKYDAVARLLVEKGWRR